MMDYFLLVIVGLWPLLFGLPLVFPRDPNQQKYILYLNWIVFALILILFALLFIFSVTYRRDQREFLELIFAVSAIGLSGIAFVTFILQIIDSVQRKRGLRPVLWSPSFFVVISSVLVLTWFVGLGLVVNSIGGI